MAITVRDDDEWGRLRALLTPPDGGGDQLYDPALATPAGRQAAHDRIDEVITAWTSTRSDTDAARALRAAGIPAGEVQGSRQLLADPQYRHRGFYHRLEHAETGSTTYAGHQYRIRDHDHGPRSAPPCLGQHTFEVLTGLLGYDVDEVAEIAASGALE